MKKIYFSGSITGGRDKEEAYKDLIKYLSNFGEVLTKNVWDEDLNNIENVSEYIYKRHKKWLDSADIIIAEITIPSIGVGYELAYSESKNKKIVCLYDESSDRPAPMMIVGNSKNKIIKYKTNEEVKEILKKVLQ